MPLSPADEQVVADMRLRAEHLKRRERAADAIQYGVRRYRGLWVAAVAAVVTVAVTVVFLVVQRTMPRREGGWAPTLVVVTVALLLGVHLGQWLLRTAWGRRRVAHQESRLRRAHSGDLHAGRRWLQFYYQDEDISPYVAQVLFFIDSEHRFDSVEEALALAKQSPGRSRTFADRAREHFDGVAAQVNRVVLSSSDENGRPSSRMMRFVTTDRPGVWYVTTAPEGPKVREFDRGVLALLTAPTESGATISSNRVRIARAPVSFTEIADLYHDQVPGYDDGMTDAEKQRELVYEVRLRSARVDSWVDRDVVEFPETP